MQEYVQERWEGVLTILEEKKLNDYALGRAMIRMANHKNPINKKIQDSGKKKAEKYFKKQHDNYLAKMELIAEYIAGMILTETEKRKAKIINGEVTTNKNETSTVVKGSIKPDINTKDLSKRISDYLKTCREKGEIGEYSVEFHDSGKFNVIIKIAK